MAIKYINGKFLKSCPERLREKIFLNTHTGKEYVAYYPSGWEALGYYNSGSQVNVTTVRIRKGDGKVFLLKNKDPLATGLCNIGDNALKSSMQVDLLVKKSFPNPKYAPKIPSILEGALICDSPTRSYLIEELVPGDNLSLRLFENASRKRQKHILLDLAKSLYKLHFKIPEASIKKSHFLVENPYVFLEGLEAYPRCGEITPILQNKTASVVHYDLAPGNIIYDWAGKAVTVIDFGCAGVTNRLEEFKRINQNYDHRFLWRFMDAYLLVHGKITKGWDR